MATTCWKSESIWSTCPSSDQTDSAAWGYAGDMVASKVYLWSLFRDGGGREFPTKGFPLSHVAAKARAEQEARVRSGWAVSPSFD